MPGGSATDRDEGDWAAFVPELLVTDLPRSIAFYRDACGFRVRFDRPEDGFAYIERGKAKIMLEEVAEDAWLTGPLDLPFGRGVNLQIEVDDIAALHDRLLASGVRLFRPLATEWYRDGETEHGQTQVLVQDPDGCLLRFMQHLGERPVSR